MKRVTRFYREINAVKIKTSYLIMLIALLFFPSFHKIEHSGDNMYKVFLNGKEVGTSDSESEAKECLKEARKSLLRETDGMVFVDTNLTFEGDELVIGKVDSKEDLTNNMKAVLQSDKLADRSSSYMIKINQFTINIRNEEEVRQVLQAALDKYDSAREFQVELVTDPNRELNVLTTKITNSTDRHKEATALPLAGIDKAFYEIDENSEMSIQATFDDYDYGMVDLYYDNEIEVIEAYLPESALSDVATATEILTRDQEKNTIYEVQPGDTLSEIAIDVNIPLDQIIAMNEMLENENSTIRVGDELIITVPEPELSVGRQEEIYYEENYDAPVEYIYNDDWYTNESKVRQQPSAGHRNVAAIVTYHNNNVEETEILKEEVTIAPVARVVEVGTKAPPTYIKPISGGRLSSQFGRRSAPKKGASTYHKGIDWATPTGTAVMASSAGTVARAGWGSGYGYVVYINHADGKQTRYGHLSKVLVSVGQHVNQGQKIALSGNTGVSTGPHIHFEILVNGVQVNPFTYLN